MFCHETYVFASEEEAIKHMETCPALLSQMGNETHEFTINGGGAASTKATNNAPLPSTTGRITNIFHRPNVDDNKEYFRESHQKTKISSLGLANSFDWHSKPKTLKNNPQYPPEERGVLVQTRGNALSLESHFSSDPKYANNGPKTPFTQPGAWAENLTVDDSEGLMSNKRVCVGDIFSICSKNVTLIVTSPRRPCSKIDLKFSRGYTKRDVRAECARSGLAGFFCKVVVADGADSADVSVGDEIRLVSRPNPRWTMERISRLIYGSDTAVMNYPVRNIMRSEWTGTGEELNELNELDGLAVCEYKEELTAMLTEEAARDTGVVLKKIDGLSNTSKAGILLSVAAAIIIAKYYKKI